jgi:hypothetical protein
MFGIDDKLFYLFNYNENLFYPLHLVVLVLQHGYNKVQNPNLLLNIFLSLLDYSTLGLIFSLNNPFNISNISY